MTRLEKLEAANKEVQDTTLNNNLAFFTILLPQKMTNFLNLTYFDEIEHEDFQHYLSSFRNDVLVASINWCKESKLNETDWQKDFTLKKCKEYTKTVLWAIKMAFEYYIGNKELLLKEEN
jgi:hypothetical protein